MAVLHLLSDPGAAASCCGTLAEDDAVLLLDDGVFALPALAKAEVRIGVLAADAERRGVEAGAVAERLDFADFVAWVAACDRSVTWS